MGFIPAGWGASNGGSPILNGMNGGGVNNNGFRQHQMQNGGGYGTLNLFLFLFLFCFSYLRVFVSLCE
jgi:hypothetical protein